MQNDNNLSTLTRIHNHYNDLPPTERKLADLLLDFPGDMASYSATELSHLAGVSKAATTRFFRRLGYKNFEQARRTARAEQKWGSPLYLVTQEPDGTLSDTHLKRQMDQELVNLTKSFENLDIAYLESIACQLLEAKHIWLLGFRNSYFLADYARCQLSQIRDEVHLLISERSTLAEQIVNIGKNDIVFAVGFRRRPKRFMQIVKAIHDNDNRILMLTEPNAGTCISYAKWVLNAEVSGTGTFDSYPAACSLIHLLISSMFHQSDRKGRNRLKQIEILHETLDDFDH